MGVGAEVVERELQGAVREERRIVEVGAGVVGPRAARGWGLVGARIGTREGRGGLQ